MVNRDVVNRLAHISVEVSDLIGDAADRDAKDALEYLSDVITHMMFDLAPDEPVLVSGGRSPSPKVANMSCAVSR
jgi:hypothetical protein